MTDPLSAKQLIGDVLPEARIRPLENDSKFLEAFLLIKVQDSAGNLSWAFRTTSPMNEEELLGALVVQTKLLKDRLAADWD